MKLFNGTPCFPWPGRPDTSGYGRVVVNGKCLKAHRAIYENVVGKIPEGLEIDHLCRNKGCVNPAHLEPVTHAENMSRAGNAATHCKNGHLREEAGFFIRTGPDGLPFKACKICARATSKRVKDRKKQRTGAVISVKNHGKKPNCKRGHPFSGDNLIVNKTTRKCRACRRMFARAGWLRKKLRNAQ